jgi:peroxiredoxin
LKLSVHRSTARSALSRCVFGALLYTSSCAAAGPPPSAPSPLLGKSLPRLSRNLQGAPIVPEQLQGRVVVIKFFADYCEPCKRTLPHAQRVHATHPEVAFIGVSMDERRSALDATIERYGITFPIIHDRSNVVAGRFRVTELPVTFIIDPQGQVRWVAGPEQAETDLELALTAFLDGDYSQ